MTVSPTAGEAAELPLEVLALPAACIKHVMSVHLPVGVCTTCG